MTTTDQQNEFIQSLNGELTPQQAAQLLEMGTQGDTGAKAPDNVAQPGANAEAGTSNTSDAAGSDGTNNGTAATGQEGATGNVELTPDNAVILAKDGKHTIGFEKLVEARQLAQDWKAKAEATQAQLASLQAQAQARADAGQAPTQVDNQVAAAQAAIEQGIDPGVFGDFSEEALAKGIQALVAQQVAAQVQQTVGKALAPIQAKQAESAADAHYSAIYEKHPDADSLVESQELAKWIDSQPSFVADACKNVLNNGTTAQIIEMFDRFKQATGAAQPGTANTADVKAAAQAAIANAPSKVPASLSDFPGGRPAAVTREEQLASMSSGTELLDAMQNGKMTPQQIEHFLNTL